MVVLVDYLTEKARFQEEIENIPTFQLRHICVIVKEDQET